MSADREIDEYEEQSSSQIEKIQDIAYELFLARGFEDVEMSDVASLAKMDTDSLIKLFPTKENLVVRTATYIWTKRMEATFPSLLKPKYNNSTGFEQLREIFTLFVKLYEKETDFLRFVYHFDAYAIKNKIPKEEMSNYESKILLVKQIISDAILKGIADGTINKKYLEYGDMLYFTLMHTFFSAAQKLSLSGKMLDMDTKMNGSFQLKLLAELLLKSLS